MTVREYFIRLREGQDHALMLATRNVRYRDGDAPIPGKCHENVDRWVDENEGCEAVRGWLLMPYGFERHSVVRAASGDLVEITLSTAYPILPHEGSQAQFDHLGEIGCNQVLGAQIA